MTAVGPQAAQGDSAKREQLGELAVRYYKVLFAIAWQVTRDQERAEEAVLEGVAKALASAHRIREAPLSYLIRCVRHAAIDLVRDRKHLRWEVGVADPELVFPTRTLEEAYGPEEKERVRRALLLLPHGPQTVLLLKFVFDLPPREIAVLLGISGAAARTRLHRAIEHLHEAYLEVAEEDRARSEPGGTPPPDLQEPPPDFSRRGRS